MIAITCFNIETCPVSSLLVLELLRPQKASNTNCPIHEIPTPPPKRARTIHRLRYVEEIDKEKGANNTTGRALVTVTPADLLALVDKADSPAVAWLVKQQWP